MRESVSRSQAQHALDAMGYRLFKEEEGWAIFHNHDNDDHWLALEFGVDIDEMPWSDLRERLEYEGIDCEEFLANLDKC